MVKITPLGVAVSGAVRGGQGLRGGAVTPVDHHRRRRVVKSATVAPWLASVKVPSRTVPGRVALDARDLVPLELVSGASRTVTPPPGGLVNVVVTPPRVVMMTLSVSGVSPGVSSA